MASKLFHAIVGVGIALGMAAGGAACSAGVDGAPDAAGDDGQGATPIDRDAGAPRNDGGDAGSTSPDDPDAAAVLDAPNDALLDAFCDATWPTTKGNSSGPTCGDVDACADAGPAPRCYPQLAPSVCDPNEVGAVAWCVSGKWQCSAGAVPSSECTCWGPLDSGGGCP